MLCNRKKKVILSTNTAHLACEAQDNAAANIISTTEKNSKVLVKLKKDVTKLHNNNKGDKVENKNEQKRILTKKCVLRVIKI